MKDMIIRNASVDDAEALLNIYAYYVKNTAITFEYEVPSLEEFKERITNTLKKYPYLVAEKEDKIVGYAYAGVFKDRAAYDWSAELSIYLAKEVTGCGIGRKLYETLESEMRERGYLNLYACIGYPIEEDEYLTNNSPLFHGHMGFTEVGRFRNCGKKFDRFYHMIWMEKLLQTVESPMNFPHPIGDIVNNDNIK